MKIGIIGAGQIGGTLTRRLAALGHKVFVANSRGPETLLNLASETGATPVSVPDAVRGMDLVIVTIPEKNIPRLPAGLFADTANRVVVVDTGNYYPRQRDGRIEYRGWSAREQVGCDATGPPRDQGIQQHICQTPPGIGPAQGRVWPHRSACCGRR
jgi:predicted dinucleotide-binding enzyme